MFKKNNNISANGKKSVHDHEHSTWSRRSFIQALGLAGGGGMMLGHAAITSSKVSPLSVALSKSENDNILVIVRLKGGNDGLNTIVPIYDYATYANLRPTIKHAQGDLLNLNSDFAIPNYMNALESVWGDGKMKVIHGVGYPDQNLSHFRSAAIWGSADAVGQTSTGWWGRYYEDLYPDYLVNPPAIPPAVQIGSIGDLIFGGDDDNFSFSVANAEQLENVAQNGTQHDVLDLPDCVYGDKLQLLRATTNTTYKYSGVINTAYMSSNNAASYSNDDLAKQLAIVARLIKGGLGTKVYMVTLDGFDTHANQENAQQRLLQDFSKSIKEFYEDLKTTGMDDKVLTMTISEFGRRPYENGSYGTDHGAASPVMLFGGGLDENGFIGEHPSLTEWDGDDNLIPTSDFRDVYSSVLTDWFCLEPSLVNRILFNQNSNPMNIGVSCGSQSTPPDPDPDPKPPKWTWEDYLTHFPWHKDDRNLIEIHMEHTANVDVRLYDFMGREVGVLESKMMFRGSNTIDVQEKLNTRLAKGYYIYRISSGGQFYSKTIQIK